MANDVDPRVREMVSRLIAEMIAPCTESAIHEILKPCTRVSITITISRGLEGFKIETSQRVGGLTSGLVSDEPVADEVWERILQLKPFSEKPDRNKDRELREVLLQVRERGYVEYRYAFKLHKLINEILHNNEIPYRFVKITAPAETYDQRGAYVIKKIV